MSIGARISYLSIAAALLLGGLTLLFMAGGRITPEPVPVASGTVAYLRDCAINQTTDEPQQAAKNPVCKSPAAITKVYHFNLMQEIGKQFYRMRKTAQDIKNGRLTDEAYADCLRSGDCAVVPMLAPGQKADSPEGKDISRRFWAIVKARHVTPAICKDIPLCRAGLANGALYATRTLIKPVKDHKK